jgi:hypothetical protein
MLYTILVPNCKNKIEIFFMYGIINIMMKPEYDFSKGERGKFYRKNIKINLPIYLEPDIREFVENIASKKGMDVETVVNEMIKNNIQLAKVIS